MNPQLKSLQKWFGGHAALIQGAATPMLVVAVLEKVMATPVAAVELELVVLGLLQDSL